MIGVLRCAEEHNWVAAMATVSSILHQAFEYYHWTVSRLVLIFDTCIDPMPCKPRPVWAGTAARTQRLTQYYCGIQLACSACNRCSGSIKPRMHAVLAEGTMRGACMGTLTEHVVPDGCSFDALIPHAMATVPSCTCKQLPTVPPLISAAMLRISHTAGLLLCVAR